MERIVDVELKRGKVRAVVEWQGVDANGVPWSDTVEPLRNISEDQHAEVLQMVDDKYGSQAAKVAEVAERKRRRAEQQPPSERLRCLL